MCRADIARRIVGRSPVRHAQPASWQGDQRATAAPGGGKRRDHRLSGLAGPEDPGQRSDPGGGTRRARLRAPRAGPGRGRPRGRLSVPLAAPWHPADHPAAPSGPRSGWGFTVQLYSVRSRQSWGHGDLRDLADLAAWSARELGAALRADQPAARGRAGAPGQRVAVPADEPEVRQPAVPAGGGHPRVRPAAVRPAAADRRPGRPAAGRQLQPRPHRPRRGLDGEARRPGDRPRPGRWPPRRRAAFGGSPSREGQALDDWATWCALAEIHGPDWRSWPAAAPVAALGSGGRRARCDCGARIEFHAWLQWTAPGAASRGAGGGTGGRA